MDTGTEVTGHPFQAREVGHRECFYKGTESKGGVIRQSRLSDQLSKEWLPGEEGAISYGFSVGSEAQGGDVHGKRQGPEFILNGSSA